MGRRKKHQRHHPLVNHAVKPTEPNISAKEQEFLDLVHMAGFEPTWQLRNWKRYFLNEHSYLIAGEEWLQAKLEGMQHPRIIDDVDRKLMAYQHEATPAPANKWWRETEYWNDAWQMGDDAPSAWTTRRQGPTLPLTPFLPAPSGHSATLQHCM